MTQPPYGGQSPYQNQGGYQDQGPGTKNKLPMLLAGLVAVLGLAIAIVIVVVGKSGSDDNQAAGGGGQSGSTTQSTQSDVSKTSDDTKGNNTNKKSSSDQPASSSDLPDGFPIPEGGEATGYGSGNEYSGLVTVTDSKAAYDFWLGALPKAGYEISDKTETGSGEGFIAQINFSGNGLNDGSISIVGTLVAITFTT